MNSAMPFVLSILAMLLSSTALDQDTVWQICSVLAFVMIVVVGQQMSGGLRRLSPQEFRAGGGSRAIFYSASVIGIAVTLLQLYNAITLKTFWPFSPQSRRCSCWPCCNLCGWSWRVTTMQSHSNRRRISSSLRLSTRTSLSRDL